MLDFKPSDMPPMGDDSPIEGLISSNQPSDEEEQLLGVFPDMPNEDYHGIKKAISNSGLSKLCPRNGSPSHLGTYLEEGSETTDAMKFGAFSHDILLMDEDFIKQHYVWKQKYDLRNKSAAAESAAFDSMLGKNQIAINADDWSMGLAMRESVMKNPESRAIVEAAKDAKTVERSHFWICERTLNYCRVRPDIEVLDRELLADFKSTGDCTPYGFSKSVYDYYYHQQQAMYTDGVEKTTGVQIKDFLFIATEKKPERPQTVVYRLDASAARLGIEAYKRHMNEYAELLESGAYFAPVSLSLPKYAF